MQECQSDFAETLRTDPRGLAHLLLAALFRLAVLLPTTEDGAEARAEWFHRIDDTMGDACHLRSAPTQTILSNNTPSPSFRVAVGIAAELFDCPKSSAVKTTAVTNANAFVTQVKITASTKRIIGSGKHHNWYFDVESVIVSM